MPPFQILPCRDEQMLARLLAFHDRFLERAACMPDDEVLARFRIVPAAFHCVVVGGELHGYFILLPVNAAGVDALRAGAITTGRQIRPEHLAARGPFEAVYLSVVCAVGPRAQKAAIEGAIDVLRELHHTEHVSTLFVRAATPAGAQMLQRLTGQTFEADGRIHAIDLAAYDTIVVPHFLRLACVDYAKWQRTDADEARRLLADHPEIPRANIWAAAAAGDAAAVRAALDADPALINAKGGPFDWEPLLYACYSRVGSTLEAARLLLERGADPNAQYLWQGLQPPFTALTGAFGEGEDDVNQPPHPECDALARLLLDGGADPNDGQALYNRHFHRNDDHLKLLFEYGLGTGERGPRLLAEELWAAARRNLPERVELLVAHGVDVNTPGLRDGRTPYEAAFRNGNLAIADYLLQHGAKKIEPNARERFAAACIAGRRDEVAALLDENPEMRRELGPHGRIELVQRAVEADHPEGVRLMAELGFEISGVTRHDNVGVNLQATPLHNASGNLAMTKLLIELGADPNVRDPNYQATPLGWAEHGGHQDVVDYLRPLTDE